MIPRMSFGQHRGRPVSAVDTPYLRWALEQFTDMWPEMRAAIEAELWLRSQRPLDEDLATELLNAGYRALTLKYHPDRPTGSLVAMQQVNDVIGFFRHALTRALAAST